MVDGATSSAASSAQLAIELSEKRNDHSYVSFLLANIFDEISKPYITFRDSFSASICSDAGFLSVSHDASARRTGLTDQCFTYENALESLTGCRQRRIFVLASYARRWRAPTAEEREAEVKARTEAKLEADAKLLNLSEAQVKARTEAKVEADARLLGVKLPDSSRLFAVQFLVQCVQDGVSGDVSFFVLDNCGEDVDGDVKGGVPPQRDNVTPPVLLFWYLFGYISSDIFLQFRIVTKTYSPGSLEFRATYVSLLLFQGSYVWIKFRDRGDAKANEGYLHWRKKEKRWEPRYSPSRTGRLSLGQYIKEDDAKVVLQAAQYYFEEKKRTVDLSDGFQYSIQHMSDEERNDTSLEKRKWVPPKAKQVLQDYKRQKKNWELEIWLDESLRDIEVNQLPNFQNEEVQVEQRHHSPQTQQFLEEQNSNLKVKIAEYDPTGGRLIQHLQSDNAKLKSILEQLKTTYGCSKNGGSG